VFNPPLVRIITCCSWPTGRIGPVAVNFDVSGVDHVEVLACAPIHLLHGRIPESILGPAAEVDIDGLLGRWRAGPRCPSLSLGDAWTENEPVFVSERIQGIDGLLGVGILADWEVWVDTLNPKSP